MGQSVSIDTLKQLQVASLLFVQAARAEQEKQEQQPAADNSLMLVGGTAAVMCVLFGAYTHATKPKQEYHEQLTVATKPAPPEVAEPQPPKTEIKQVVTNAADYQASKLYKALD